MIYNALNGTLDREEKGSNGEKNNLYNWVIVYQQSSG